MWAAPSNRLGTKMEQRGKKKATFKNRSALTVLPSYPEMSILAWSHPFCHDVVPHLRIKSM
jgi:hypothetical protein